MTGMARPFGIKGCTPESPLAGDRGIAFLPEPHPLGVEGRKGEKEQNDGQNGGAALIVLRADDGEENLGREHVEIAAQNQRISEIGHAFDEAQQERIGETGSHQRQGDRPEGLPPVRPQGLRRLLHRRGYPLDHTDQHQKRDRGKGKGLRDQHAGHAVEPSCGLQTKEVPRRTGSRCQTGRTAGSVRGQ